MGVNAACVSEHSANEVETHFIKLLFHHLYLITSAFCWGGRNSKLYEEYIMKLIKLFVVVCFMLSATTALAVPPNTLALGEMQTILALPVGDNPEGIAVDGPNIYVGNRRFVELDGGGCLRVGDP